MRFGNLHITISGENEFMRLVYYLTIEFRLDLIQRKPLFRLNEWR